MFIVTTERAVYRITQIKIQGLSKPPGANAQTHFKWVKINVELLKEYFVDIRCETNIVERNITNTYIVEHPSSQCLLSSHFFIQSVLTGLKLPQLFQEVPRSRWSVFTNMAYVIQKL